MKLISFYKIFVLIHRFCETFKIAHLYLAGFPSPFGDFDSPKNELLVFGFGKVPFVPPL